MEGSTHGSGATNHMQPAKTVQLPSPTAWPMVFALGVSLIIGGMVTHWAISLLGLMMALPAIVGWFSEVVPDEHHIYVPVQVKSKGKRRKKPKNNNKKRWSMIRNH